MTAHSPIPAPGDLQLLSPDQQEELCVLRHVCIAFARGEPDIPAAREIARSLWGGTGPARAEALRALLVAMRRSRRRTFTYNDPACPCCCRRLTANERCLMALIRAARGLSQAGLTGQAMILCEGGPLDEVIAAARQLALAFPADPA